MSGPGRKRATPQDEARTMLRDLADNPSPSRASWHAIRGQARLLANAVLNAPAADSRLAEIARAATSDSAHDKRMADMMIGEIDSDMRDILNRDIHGDPLSTACHLADIIAWALGDQYGRAKDDQIPLLYELGLVEWPEGAAEGQDHG